MKAMKVKVFRGGQLISLTRPRTLRQYLDRYTCWPGKSSLLLVDETGEETLIFIPGDLEEYEPLMDNWVREVHLPTVNI